MTTFKVNSRYRHKSCLDIDFDVISVLNCSDDCISVVVTYWNRHYKIHQGQAEAVHIKTKDINNWEEIENIT